MASTTDVYGVNVNKRTETTMTNQERKPMSECALNHSESLIKFTSLLNLHDIDIKAIREIMNERDRMYTERASSQSTAVAAALAAQKEASIKTENYQKDYNVQHNDLMRKMDHQAESFVSRPEYMAAHIELGKRLDGEASQRQIDKDAVLKRLAESVVEIVKRIEGEASFRLNDREATMKEIAALREYNSRGFGEKAAKSEDRGDQRWSIGVIISLAVSVGGWIVMLLSRFVK